MDGAMYEEAVLGVRAHARQVERALGAVHVPPAIRAGDAHFAARAQTDVTLPIEHTTTDQVLARERLVAYVWWDRRRWRSRSRGCRARVQLGGREAAAAVQLLRPRHRHGVGCHHPERGLDH